MTTPPYPNFTGFEPCATTDPELFHPDPGVRGGVSPARLRAICEGCRVSTFRQCREWAIHFESFGFWGGTTAIEREAIRRERGLTISPTWRSAV